MPTTPRLLLLLLRLHAREIVHRIRVLLMSCCSLWVCA